MFKVRNNPLTGTLISVAGLIIFAAGIYYRDTMETEGWIGIVGGLLNVFFGFFLITQTRITVTAKELTIKNMVGKKISSYVLDRATGMNLENGKVILEKDGKRIEVPNIEESSCNKKDWEAFKGMISDRENARLGGKQKKG